MQSTTPIFEPRKPSASSSTPNKLGGHRSSKASRPQPNAFAKSAPPLPAAAAGNERRGVAPVQSPQSARQAGQSEQQGPVFSLRTPRLPATATTSTSNITKGGLAGTKVSNDPSAPVVVVGAERDSVPFQLCCQALAEGCVQTYMHLFHLAHRDPVCVDALSHRFFSLSADRLVWVQQHLSAVEVLRRQSEFAQVLTHCQQLADYFESEKDYTEALWYHETGLQYMTESLDRRLEQGARHAAATFQERQGHLEEALGLFETMYRLAASLDDDETLQQANRCLMRVHQMLGDAASFSDPQAAARHYAKAAEAAERGKSGAAEGAAYSALGDVSEARGDLPLALRYQRNFRALAKRDDLKPEECRATLRVADLEERLGLKLEASTTLMEALKLAKEFGQPRQLCMATLQLGEAYRSRDQEQQALQCFEESFAAAMETGDQELIDTVRIAMGFARGDYYLTHAYSGEGYLHLVCTDIRSQLAWMSGGTL